jgi:hypothetical protein
MKNLFKTFLILLIVNLGFSQTSKTILNKDGLTVSYVLSKIGNVVNPITGTNFSKYNLHLTVNNSSSKFWAFNGVNSISSKDVKGGILKIDDETYVWNGGHSIIDHFCIEDNCTDFPRYDNVAAPHQVICPNSTQECEKVFLHPTDLAGDPEIIWTTWSFEEMVSKNIDIKQNTVSSKKNTNLTKKTAIIPKPLNQYLAYKGVNKVQEMRALLFKFLQENVVMPNNSRYYGETFILNFEVDENGKIINPIAYGKYPEINEAAIKALKLSEGDWSIQIIDGKKVSTPMGLSLGFPVDE